MMQIQEPIILLRTRARNRWLRGIRLCLLTLLLVAAGTGIGPYESGKGDLGAGSYAFGAETYAQGAAVKGTFPLEAGYELTTVRYYTDSEHTAYELAQVNLKEDGTGYDYEFVAPYDGFAGTTAFEHVRDTAQNDADIIGEYCNSQVWDGAVDVSWYDESSSEFHISTPAQLAGLAAIVNGSTDVSCKDYMIKGDASLIANRVEQEGSLPAGGKGIIHHGLAKNTFADRTVILEADLDMGGADGADINHTNYNDGKSQYDYPNWTPIGGEYLMDVGDITTMIKAHFNGVFDGNGHKIENLYCYRWAYPKEGVNAYAYAQGTGLFGMMGIYLEGEREPVKNPGVKNLSLSGYVYGRRMVGGIVGAIGGGSNAVNGASVSCQVRIENVANHAYVYNTDSKGIGGIIGCSMGKGAVINCYNDGRISSVYANPGGGIVGSNEHMNIYCCYNRGRVTTGSSKFGRGIGGLGNSPGSFKVDSCYYLEGCGDDPTYPGYYTYNLPASCSINVTALEASAMTDGTLLNALNVNGNAYVAGADGYPILLWEAGGGSGSVTFLQPEGGLVSDEYGNADPLTEMKGGTVIYLSAQADTGYKFRYYTLNGQVMTGDYVTVNGSSEVSAYVETMKAGVLKIPSSATCTITVVKTGQIKVDGQLVPVENHEVNAGDELFEGDVLTVKAVLKSGLVPDDESMDYKAAVGQPNAYEYTFTYLNQESEETVGTPASQVNPNFTVTSEISLENVTLILTVAPIATEKMWVNRADTSWYDAGKTSFTLTTASQLAGLDQLVESGNHFEGKKILLGNNISLKNNDGTSGFRYWDGIGNASSDGYFAGTFDGKGYSITDYKGKGNGLFAQVKGSASNYAVVQNVSVYGNASGAMVCGILAKGSYVKVTGCSSFVEISDATGYGAGILAQDAGYSILDSCVNYGNISATTYVAGIAGKLSGTGTIKNCINRGRITVEDSSNNHVGGIVAQNSGSLKACGNYGDILAYGRNIGGIAGYCLTDKSSMPSLTDCYNVGNLTYKAGKSSFDTLGGLVGYGLLFNITNSYNYGTVKRSSGCMTDYMGSAIGRDSRNSKNKITNVYLYETANPDGYVSMSTALKDLVSLKADYYGSIQNVTKVAFASTTSSGVLKKINTDGNYVLVNGKYPEIALAAENHKHSGGTATCTKRAVCKTCGVAYGSLKSSNHVRKETRNQKDPVWKKPGYSGDIYCKDCGKLIESGQEVAAEANVIGLRVKISDPLYGNRLVEFTREELNQLSTVDQAIGYSYGGTSKTLMVSTEYVTIDKLLASLKLSLEDVEKLQVLCSSSTSNLDQETLSDCRWYYDEAGNASEAPPALAITYGTVSGTIADGLPEARTMGDLRFGYGISEAQYQNKEELGGKRLVSPVETLVIQLVPACTEGRLTGDANLDGVLSVADVTEIARLAGSAGEEAYVKWCNADTDGDGLVTKTDALHLADYLIGKVSLLKADKAIGMTSAKPLTDGIDSSNNCQPKSLSVKKDQYVQVTIGMNGMTTGSYLGGLRYNPTYVKLVKTSKTKVTLNSSLSLSVSSVKGTKPYICMEGTAGKQTKVTSKSDILVLTFQVVKSGTTKFSLFELMDGTPVKGVEAGSIKASYIIKQCSQTITTTTLSKTYKASVLKTKSQSFLIGGKAKTTISYAKLSGSSKLTLDKKTGKVTVIKGTKKGTYTMKVKLSAKETDVYKETTLTKTITVQVK